LKKKFTTEEERIAYKKAYMKEYRQRNKEKLYAADKAKTQLRRKVNKARAVAYLGGSCNHCGLTTPNLSVYDFHHLNKKRKGGRPR
jgi:hypothetical protein